VAHQPSTCIGRARPAPAIIFCSCDGFSEKAPSWICPGCGRSKPQIVAPGPNVNVVACIYLHHDHIKDLIARLLDRELPKPLSRHESVARRLLKIELMRRFCRFKAVDVCHACNNVDTAAKKIVGAPWWFSFFPRGIRNVIQPPEPYAKPSRDRPRSTARGLAPGVERD
jgi:hypothetical protein